MFHDRVTSEGDGPLAKSINTVQLPNSRRYDGVQEAFSTATTDPQYGSPIDISEHSHSSDTRYSKSNTTHGMKIHMDVKPANHQMESMSGVDGNRHAQINSKTMTVRRGKSVIVNSDDGIDGEEEDSDTNPVQEPGGAQRTSQVSRPGSEWSSRKDITRSPVNGLVDLATVGNTVEQSQNAPVSPPSGRTQPIRPRTPSASAAKRYPRDRQRSGNIQTRTNAAPQPSTRNSANRVMQLTQADIRKQARERERRHVRDRAYMRFVPGLGLSSGTTLAILDPDSAYMDEQQRRPRSKSLGESESQLSFFGGHGVQGPSKADRDEAAATVAAQVFRDAQDRVTSRPGPNGMPGVKASALPHFSLDTKFSLVLPRTGHDLSRFVSPIGSGSRSGRGDTSGGDETPVIESVEFDLGLGKDLDHTIAKALKVAQQQASKVTASVTATARADSHVAAPSGMVDTAQEKQTRGIESTKSPLLSAKPVTVSSGVADDMPEMPLPAEAARVLSEARQAVVNCRATSGSLPKSKTGRKASMGMGLFKETAETKTDISEIRADASKSKTPTIEEENPYQKESRSDHRNLKVDQTKEHEALSQFRQQPSEERPQLASRSSGSRAKAAEGSSEPSRKAASGSMTPTRERERSRLLAHYLTKTSTRPNDSLYPSTEFESSPQRTLGISPVTSRPTSRAVSPTVHDSYDDQLGWSSGASWETSSGISSSESSDDYDERIEEDYPMPTLEETTEHRDQHTGLHYFGHSHGSQDGLVTGSMPERNFDIRSDTAARQHNQSGGEMTIPLQPFNNKVGGHSEIYKFTRRAVCKVRSISSRVESSF